MRAALQFVSGISWSRTTIQHVNAVRPDLGAGVGLKGFFSSLVNLIQWSLHRGLSSNFMFGVAEVSLGNSLKKL